MNNKMNFELSHIKSLSPRGDSNNMGIATNNNTWDSNTGVNQGESAATNQNRSKVPDIILDTSSDDHQLKQWYLSCKTTTHTHSRYM